MVTFVKLLWGLTLRYDCEVSVDRSVHFIKLYIVMLVFVTFIDLLIQKCQGHCRVWTRKIQFFFFQSDSDCFITMLLVKWHLLVTNQYYTLTVLSGTVFCMWCEDMIICEHVWYGWTELLTFVLCRHEPVPRWVQWLWSWSEWKQYAGHGFSSGQLWKCQYGKLLYFQCPCCCYWPVSMCECFNLFVTDIVISFDSLFFFLHNGQIMLPGLYENVLV